MLHLGVNVPDIDVSRERVARVKGAFAARIHELFDLEQLEFWSNLQLQLGQIERQDTLFSRSVPILSLLLDPGRGGRTRTRGGEDERGGGRGVGEEEEEGAEEE